jgi:hypothetical protein
MAASATRAWSSDEQDEHGDVIGTSRRTNWDFMELHQQDYAKCGFNDPKLGRKLGLNLIELSNLGIYLR